MLEQRRAQKLGYITLREAADFAGYSPDYVGQLIRAGKLRGEQVYSGVAWVTTKEEIKAYLQDKHRTVDRSDKKSFLMRCTHFFLTAHHQYRASFYVILFGSAIIAMQLAIFASLQHLDSVAVYSDSSYEASMYE